jgi:peptide/nickel transport system substrate-binding protein
MIAVWAGIENALPTAASSPRELAPGTQGDLQWPKWGLFRESKGKAGEPCDMPEVQHLIDLVGQWERTVDRAKQLAIWHEILAAHADQQFTIGTVSGSRQPVVVSRRLRNVPHTGVHSWHPGAFFGIYRPDTFWLES